MSDAELRSSPVRAYAELGRVSNCPTTISNVFVGIAIGKASLPGQAQWWEYGVVMLAVLLLYVGGMALNDVIDAKRDRQQRPGRPIPSGRIARKEAAAFAALCLLAGFALFAPFGWSARFLAAALVLTIIAYDVVHAMTPLSGILMGVCRGLVYMAVAACFAWPLDWPITLSLVFALTAYIAVVTYIARSEAGSAVNARLVQRLSITLPLIALLPALWVVPAWWLPAIVAGVAVVGWLIWTQRHLLVFPQRTSRAVLGYLAGISLLDALYLSLLDQPLLALVAAACFGVTVLGHRTISGT